jgi:peptidyl-prolyl cis-trans isomerase C
VAFVIEDDADAETTVGINTVCAGTLQVQTVEQVDDCGVVREANRDKARQTDRPSDIRARHILLSSESAAFEAIGLLQAGGSFSDIAKSRSIGPSGPNGGDLGWFKPENMPSVFSTALLQFDNCEYHPEPVKSEFGWHVILRLESK